MLFDVLAAAVLSTEASRYLTDESARIPDGTSGPGTMANGGLDQPISVR
jgi:hypothetical protein